MTTAEGITLRLKWKHTWPDMDEDFVAHAPGYNLGIGRIYRLGGGPRGGEWFWSMTAFGNGIRHEGTLSGVEATPREAARRVEQAWFAASSPASG